MENRLTAPRMSVEEKENIMSMDNDTRLSMMALRDRTNNAPAPRRTRRARSARNIVAPTAAAMASFALTLFTRGA